MLTNIIKEIEIMTNLIDYKKLNEHQKFCLKNIEQNAKWLERSFNSGISNTSKDGKEKLMYTFNKNSYDFLRTLPLKDLNLLVKSLK